MDALAKEKANFMATYDNIYGRLITKLGHRLAETFFLHSSRAGDSAKKTTTTTTQTSSQPAGKAAPPPASQPALVAVDSNIQTSPSAQAAPATPAAEATVPSPETATKAAA